LTDLLNNNDDPVKIQLYCENPNESTYFERVD